MPTISPPTHADSWPRRDECLAAIDRDGFTILPHLLPQDMIDRANAYIGAAPASTAKRRIRATLRPI